MIALLTDNIIIGIPGLYFKLQKRNFIQKKPKQWKHLF